jgi:hypothetical protein
MTTITRAVQAALHARGERVVNETPKYLVFSFRYKANRDESGNLVPRKVFCYLRVSKRGPSMRLSSMPLAARFGTLPLNSEARESLVREGLQVLSAKKGVRNAQS